MVETDKKIIAIIPARGGSKRIPEKNIMSLAGKPLIAYTIEAAKNSGYIDRVIVSTDDEKIAEISREYGAEIIIRPKEFAQDNSSSEDALLHVIKHLNENESYDPDYIVMLQATSPLRGTKLIDMAIEKAITTNADSVLSVCEAQHYYLAGLIEEDKYIPEYEKRPFSHEMPKKFRETGAVYVTKKEHLIKTKNRLGGDQRAIVMDPVSSIDIDDENDFKLIERVIKAMNNKKMNKIKLGRKAISDEDPIFFIAEIGINHNGSLENAKKLIDMAVMLGADAVKFQKRTPEICVPEHQRNIPRETPWGTMSYFDYKKMIEFEEEEYKEIDRYCKEKGILWFASPWDLTSYEFLEKFEVPIHKIASAKLTDKELLMKLKESKKPILLSTGGSTIEQVRKAVSLLEDTNPLVIMHCNSGYPANERELNLKTIETLKREFPNHVIGYSGHELGITASVIAASLGARVIERHITLDRTMWGTDHAASLEFEGLRRLIRDLRKLDNWLGDGIKTVTETESNVMKKLRDKDTL